MLKNNSSLDIRRQIFPYGYTSTYVLESELPAASLPNLAHGILHSLIPVAALSGGSEKIRDIKGCYDPQWISSPHPGLAGPGFEEIFYVEGNIPVADSLHGDLLRTKDCAGFEMAVLSAFSEFSGSHHIIYNLLDKRHGELPDFIATRDVARVFPLELEYVRFGIEMFKSRFFGSMLGFTPAVTETLSIEADQKRVFVKISAESLKSRETFPLQRDGLGIKLSKLTNSIIAINWLEDYAARAG